MMVSGVDLAGQPANTAMCVLEWRPTRRCRELVAGVDDAAVVDAALRTEKCGIDAPLGWPDAFVEVVTRHHAAEPTVVPESSEPLRLRTTDRWVWRTYGRIPLSVSTDNIGVVALRGVRIQGEIASRMGSAVDRSGAGRAVEVYPAAALRVWGLPHSGYKRGETAAAVRETIVSHLVRAFGIELAPEHRTLAVDSHDALDAFVSAIVAALSADGATVPPPPEMHDVARREGWIHVPATDGLPA